MEDEGGGREGERRSVWKATSDTRARYLSDTMKPCGGARRVKIRPGSRDAGQAGRTVVPSASCRAFDSPPRGTAEPGSSQAWPPSAYLRILAEIARSHHCRIGTARRSNRRRLAPRTGPTSRPTTSPPPFLSLFRLSHAHAAHERSYSIAQPQHFPTRFIVLNGPCHRPEPTSTFATGSFPRRT